jgi:hypothetical protein
MGRRSLSWHPASFEGRGRLQLGLHGAHIAAALVVSSRRGYPAHDAASADAKEVPRDVSATTLAEAELPLALRHVAQLPRIKHPRVAGAVAAAAEHSSAGTEATASSERVHQVVQVRVALFHVRRRWPHVWGRAREASEHGRRAGAVGARGRAHLRRLLEQSGRRHLRQHGGLVSVEPRRWNLISTSTNEVPAKNPCRRLCLRTAAAELVTVHEPLTCMLVTGPPRAAVAIVSKETQAEERAGA